MNTTEFESTERSSPEAVAEAEKRPSLEVNLQTPSTSTTLALPPADPTPTDQWREWGTQIKQVLAELPDYIGEFFADNQRVIISLGLLFAGIVSLKLTLAVLDAINDIPLLAPTFELVGIGYTIWFVYRYLLQASTRQELSQEIQNFKGQLLGQDSQGS
jgi:hypothetical protein